MAITLAEACAALEQYGMHPELRGDAARVLNGVNTLEDAGAGEVSFLSNPKYEKYLQTTSASVVVIGAETEAPSHLDLIRVDDPYAAITVLIVKLHGYRQHRQPARTATGVIAPSAKIGPRRSDSRRRHN